MSVLLLIKETGLMQDSANPFSIGVKYYLFFLE